MKTISLTQGYVTQVDDSDFEWLNKFKWHTRKFGQKIYAIRREYRGKNSRWIRMHRQILCALPDEEGDHIDGNGLNNQRHNLRLCSHQRNSQSFRKKADSATSKFRGVSWQKLSKKWTAKISPCGKNIYLGIFQSEIEAAKAYDVSAKQYFGEFAQLNFSI
jgi:hypothetical protein